MAREDAGSVHARRAQQCASSPIWQRGTIGNPQTKGARTGMARMKKAIVDLLLPPRAMLADDRVCRGKTSVGCGAKRRVQMMRTREAGSPYRLMAGSRRIRRRSTAVKAAGETKEAAKRARKFFTIS